MALSVRQKVRDMNRNIGGENPVRSRDNRLELTFAAKSFLRQNFITILRPDLASRSTCNDIFIVQFTLA